MTTNYEIICVDDDLDVLEVTCELVQKLGYTTQSFSDVLKAVDYVKDHQSSIMMILSDLRMDNNNGFDFKEILKNSGVDIPFVIITGYWTKEFSVTAMELGVDAFIEKPTTMENIDELIKKFALVRAQILDDEKEMVSGFIEETIPMLDEIESLILELEENPESEQTLSIYFRLLHTIKGTASCVGLSKLANYGHQYEDFIGELRSRTIPVNTGSINVLLKGLDDLKIIFNTVQSKGNDNEFNIEKMVEVFDPRKISDVVPVKKEEKKNGPKKDKEEKKEEDRMMVSMDILNDFMEESGELTVIRNTIVKTVKKIETKFRGDKDIETLNELLVGMYNITSNIQGKITQLRQVSLKNTFRPFKRLVRDLSKKLSKDVQLEIGGDELLVDNIVAKLYSNTLIHVVRNSLDHGLETPEQRKQKGKSAEGTLQFDVQEVGEDIHLKITDDGKGINPEVIKAKALEKGLFTEDELDLMSQEQIVNLIFASGFSTAENVSDLSGRGVGMDMVRGSFEALGGQVFVHSQVDQGSTFHMIVPVPKSVLIINSLLVDTCGKYFIFQMEDVAEVIRYEKELPHSKLYWVDGQKVISQNDEVIQIISLRKTLKLDSKEKPSCEDEGVCNIVVIRCGEMKYGVEVDQIFEFEEVVLRKIPEDLVCSDLYLGASLLGMGDLAMVIDSSGLAKRSELELSNSVKQYEFDKEDVIEINEDLKEYMLFKTDHENTMGLPLEKVDRLEKFNPQDFSMTGNNTITNYYGNPLQIIDPAFVLGLKDKSLVEDLDLHKKDLVSVIVVHSEKRKIGYLVYALDEIGKSYDEMNKDTVDVEGLEGSVYLKETTVCILDTEFIEEKISHRKKMISLNEHLEFSNVEDESDEVMAA